MSTDAALAAVLDVDAPDRRDHIRSLIDSTDEGLDERILAMLAGQRATVASVLCRVLAERRPDRDPSYAFDCFARSKRGSADRVESWVGRQAYRHPLGLHYGICRLRLAAPVEHYAVNAAHWTAMRRFAAVLALGDTADVAAVPLVVKALRDRNWRVRVEATGAIRRLSRDGAVAPAVVDSVADSLVACLSDRKPKVVEYAAITLSVSTMRDRLEEARRSSRLKPETIEVVNAALDGKVPALRPTWPGDIGSADGE
ncbi:hypothetical protein JOF56_005850 [Kibdelosporangium banguiense]|uniref:HEAT repeat domain-containing protein n=1 Tax=Kibdelosporangium banguiense TaxID=1365924 RepID=A0ABS4TM26_9PSEU|nr:HEAT repeat domain-containing protein [Kibdelosporangium banguiense]MBP2325465.1 hypothetical protein [Kibdelosporangium banguiense]